MNDLERSKRMLVLCLVPREKQSLKFELKETNALTFCKNHRHVKFEGVSVFDVSLVDLEMGDLPRAQT